MLTDSPHTLGERLQDFWQHLPLRWLGILTAGLPFAAVVASAVLAFLGNQNRQRMETAVTRHFEMSARLSDLLVLMLNAETGLRGDLLSRDTEFSTPFLHAQQALPGELERLSAFVEAEPGEGPRREKRARLAEIRATVGGEMALLDTLHREGKEQAPAAGQAADPALASQLVESKHLMDKLREQLRGMQSEELSLLGQRLDEIRRVRRRDYLSISLALLLGLATRFVVFWLFHRRVTTRVTRLTENVRALAAGEPPPHPPSGRQDAIGELEEELQKVRTQPAA